MPTVLLAVALFAQILDPQAPQQAYTTADPNNPDRLGLATLTGRYSITPIQDCGDITTEQNVLMWPDYRMPPWLSIAPLDGTLPGCLVRVEGRMSEVSCSITDGVCDINSEVPS